MPIIEKCKSFGTINNNNASMRDVLEAIYGKGDTAYYRINQMLGVSGGNNSRSIDQGFQVSEAEEFDAQDAGVEQLINRITLYLDTCVNHNEVTAGIVWLINIGWIYRYLTNFRFNEKVGRREYLSGWTMPDLCTGKSKSIPNDAVLNRKIELFNEFHKSLNAKLDEYFNVDLIKKVDDEFNNFFFDLKRYTSIDDETFDAIKQARSYLLSPNDNYIILKLNRVIEQSGSYYEDLNASRTAMRRNIKSLIKPELAILFDKFDIKKTTYQVNCNNFKVRLGKILGDEFKNMFGVL